MSKIICEVCGSRYPDTSAQCPICGCINAKAANAPEEIREPVVKADAPERTSTPGGRFSKSNVNKRNQGKVFHDEPVKPVAKREKPQVKPQVMDEYDLEEEFEEESGKKRGGFVNVLLVIVIIALLGVCAYIFVQFFMPSFFGSDPIIGTEAPTVAATEAPTEAPGPTLPPVIPCQKLSMEEKTITLQSAGQTHQLTVQLMPENTTDGLIYISSNEAVATVSEDGTLTAVGEGSVVITVFCGAHQLECNVICDFSAAPVVDNQGQTGAEPGTESDTGATAATEAAGEQKTVTSKNLNVRKEANSKSEKVGSYKKGDVVTVYEQKKVGSQYWGRIDGGWICMDYVK